MEHNLTVLTRYGLHWHSASRRLFRLARTADGYEATHTASWHIGRGSTIEAAMNDAAAGWNETAPEACDLWPEFTRIAA